jgi:hypothetical protein
MLKECRRQHWRPSKQFLRQRHDVKVIVEMFTTSAMLGKACHARMALAIMADAFEVAPSRISEEDVGAEIDGLSRSLETPASASKFSQIHCAVDRHKDIGVFRYRLARRQRPHERNTQHARTNLCRPDKRADGEKECPARFGDRRFRAVGLVAAHLI